MKKSTLRAYARLIARTGVNVQKGQEAMVFAGLDQPEFVQMLVEELYKAKAKKVTVEWRYQPLSRVHNRYRSVKTMAAIEDWELARFQHTVDVKPCRIHLSSDDPDGLKGMNMEKQSKAQKLRYPIIKPYQEQLENQRQWCIAAVPGVAWAKKMFPDLPKGKAVEKLWEAILAASRVTEDPEGAWREHNQDLTDRCRYLNDLHIAKLHYQAANGTDFTVGLIPQGRFCGGQERSRQGIAFNPNIPSEECFTTPMRGQAEGTVYATKPLSYRGQLIDNFSVRFENGKAVEVKAEKGQDLLEDMIRMDEGAAYLGECALVPQASPIAQSGLLFYSTLFDENAACHLALGRGFNDCIHGFESMTGEECKALGVNSSMIHVDFMIGCDSMNIDAITEDGRTVPVFRNGNWAF